MGTKMPRVSIVIAVKNEEQFLSLTLQSIRDQTFGDFEVIVVDDGSTDGTRDVALMTSLADPRFRLLSNHFTPGQSGALNCGIDVAAAPLIARCDGDDLWAPDKLEKQIEFIDRWEKSAPLVVLGTGGYTINETGRILGTLDVGITEIEHYSIMRRDECVFMLHHTSVIFDKQVYQKVGGYRSDYVGAEDADLFTRMAEHGVVLNLAQRLFYYRKHIGSFSLASTRVQALNFLRIRQNVRRRTQGHAELGYEDFERYISENWDVNEARRFEREIRGRLLYRRGTVLVINGCRVKGAALLARAALTHPNMVYNGLHSVVARYLPRLSGR